LAGSNRLPSTAGGGGSDSISATDTAISPLIDDPDMMAAFDGPGHTVRLIRNHEVTAINAIPFSRVFIHHPTPAGREIAPGRPSVDAAPQARPPGWHRTTSACQGSIPPRLQKTFASFADRGFGSRHAVLPARFAAGQRGLVVSLR
jgi:hypothetical protein